MRGPETRLGDLIESFLLAKEAEGRSLRTIADYGIYLHQFDRSIGSPTLGQLTPEVVTATSPSAAAAHPPPRASPRPRSSPWPPGSPGWAISPPPWAARCWPPSRPPASIGTGPHTPMTKCSR